MDQVELYQLLESTGLPVSYYQFLSPPPLPYIVYLTDEAEAWGGDELNVVQSIVYLVELYTTKKDLATQRLIESLFDERGIKYTCNETYIETEGLYQTSYKIEFTMKIRRSS